MRYLYVQMDTMFQGMSIMMLSGGLVPLTMPPPPLCFARDPGSSSATAMDAPFHGDDPLTDDPDLIEDSDED